MSHSPDITIVLAHFNDGEHVIDAVRSVYGQTHKNIELLLVDDCSTDGSAETARSIVEQDPRGRFLSLDVNSGGVGGPRSRGLEEARGDYVLFLDSDDTLDRHACKNLLHEAETSDADIVMARTRRFEIEAQRWKGWHDKLYVSREYYESIEDNPELSIDTIVVAKLYKVEFLRKNSIQFPTDIHYEDLVFSAKAFMNASGISVIPQSAYVWNIYPNEVRKSITNQRDSIKNLIYRLEALTRVEKAVDCSKNPGLFSRLQLKILRHDARLYLNDIVSHDDELALEILKVLKPFLLKVSPEAYAQLDVPERFLYGAALMLRPDIVRDAFTMINKRATWIPPLEPDVESSTYRWHSESTNELSTEPLCGALLSVDKSDVESTPWFQVEWYHEVREIQVNSGILSVRGRTFDPGAKLSALSSPNLSLRIFSRGKNKFSKILKCENVVYDGQWVLWDALITVPANWPAVDVDKIGIRPRISNQLTSREGHLVIPTSIKIPKKRLFNRGLINRVEAYRYRVYRTVDGTMGVRRLKSGTKRILVRRIISPVSKYRVIKDSVFDRPVKTNSLRWKTIYSLLRMLPLDSDSTLFESHMGTSTSDSPGVISSTLASHYPNHKQNWSIAQSKIIDGDYNSVTRHSAKYLYALARSRYLVDNQSLPSYFVKRKSQIYLQLWHGIPLKRMGLDEPDFADASMAKKRELVKKASYWDYLTVPNPYFETTFVPAFGYKNELLKYGSPRNDILAKLDNSMADNFRIMLGLPRDRKIVLYAPTFRANSRNSKRAIKLELDLEGWIDDLGDDCILLIRAHYLNKISIHPKFAGKIVDVSGIDDISSLFAVSDLLITDYSSVMFDYCTLDRPILIYAYDYENYVNDERGTYFSLEEFSPGLIVKDQQSLHKAVLERLTVDLDKDERHKFSQRFAGFEDGDSADRTVERVWG